MTDPFSMKELKDALKKVKTRKAPGPDGITGKTLKHLGACSRTVLLKIFNHSWMKRVVPAVWKEANVIPVPKKGKDKKNPRSYRPISLLSCVGKLLERMVNRRLINHLESNNVLSPTQTGYRKFRSAEDQLAYLAQNIEDAFQEKRKVLAVFFDLSNAFDKVWKEGLIVKLLRTGVRCKMYMWIQHFLFARTARVKLDGILSKKSLPSRKSTTGQCSVPHTVPGLHQWYPYHYNKEGLKHATCRWPGNLECVWAHHHCNLQDPRSHQWYQQVGPGLGPRDKHYQNKQHSLLPFHLEGTDQTAAEGWDRAPGRHPDLPWCEAGHTTYLEATDREGGEKRSVESSRDEKARRNYLGADSSILTKVYTATVRPTMEYAERRQLTWPQGADLATKLWGSAEDLYRTAGFVASTILNIWPARLSIAEEEEGVF